MHSKIVFDFYCETGIFIFNFQHESMVTKESKETLVRCCFWVTLKSFLSQCHTCSCCTLQCWTENNCETVKVGIQITEQCCTAVQEELFWTAALCCKCLLMLFKDRWSFSSTAVVKPRNVSSGHTTFQNYFLESDIYAAQNAAAGIKHKIRGD